MVLSPQAMLGGFAMTKWIVVSVLLSICSCSSTEPAVAEIEIDKNDYSELKPDRSSNYRFYPLPSDDVLDYGFCLGEGWGRGSSTHISPALSREYDYRPSSGKTIDLNFVKKDIHTVMHFIALRTGLKIIVDGEIGHLFISVMYREADPMDVIESICKANNLILVRDGEFIIIKRRTAGKREQIQRQFC